MTNIFIIDWSPMFPDDCFCYQIPCICNLIVESVITVWSSKWNLERTVTVADGAWSPAGDKGEYFGIPGKGCWYRKPGGQPYWTTGGVHMLYEVMGFEGGPLGMPISNFNNDSGSQQFDGGYIVWNGSKFVFSANGDNGQSFEMPAPPEQPR